MDIGLKYCTDSFLWHIRTANDTKSLRIYDCSTWFPGCLLFPRSIAIFHSNSTCNDPPCDLLPCFTVITRRRRFVRPWRGAGPGPWVKAFLGRACMCARGARDQRHSLSLFGDPWWGASPGQPDPWDSSVAPGVGQSGTSVGKAVCCKWSLFGPRFWINHKICPFDFLARWVGILKTYELYQRFSSN